MTRTGKSVFALDPKRCGLRSAHTAMSNERKKFPGCFTLMPLTLFYWQATYSLSDGYKEGNGSLDTELRD